MRASPFTHAATGFLPYAQLRHHTGPAWWRPLLALLLAATLYAAWLAALRWGFAAFLAPLQPGTALATLIGLNLALVGLIPASMLGARLGFGQPAGWLASVAERLRWRWLVQAWCAGLACMGLLALLDAFWLDPLRWSPEPQAMALLLMLVVMTPLQCAGEEVFFRGLLPQCLGAWCRTTSVAFWITLLLPAALFAAVHGEQTAVLFATRMLMGMLFGWLAWRTGGLEAPIALHTLNNQTVFAEAIAGGSLQRSLFATHASVLQATVQLAVLALAAALMLRRFRRVQAASPAPA